ncbi:hypothetical protein GDO86_013404 [Hymenochirus boettgeri]|uniref:Tetratricopeptide repeat protein 31 n=1 Tax=Hymenochirus boettgeri TaxID=247094 RepID=A0A8T2IWK2_9PIPI|nr:hypothetical protein GDO86_013404 [Hymenochirus boettgeri]KAG8435454.1 hypothetical protein GDO86_013404 [Hymenochirus boettgeri]
MDFETPAGICGCRKDIMLRKDLNLQEEEILSDHFLSEDSQTKQKAEKRRAKKKRQRERKKLEKKKHLEEKEQEPEWDVNSAFVANAASHLRPKTRSKTDKKHNSNKENERKMPEGDRLNSSVERSRHLAECGINCVKEGNYLKAIELFSEAIRLDPKDYRYFGNRSYCYEQLKLYPKALTDAEVSIELSPDCPKGYFRKGRALRGCSRFSEAEDAFKMVLQLDEGCGEALKEIQIMRHMEQSVTAVLETPISIQESNLIEALEEAVEEEMFGQTDLLETPSASLWVGNVTDQITEKQLKDLFKCYGDIHSIRLLGERFCAFVNFRCVVDAARALDALQGKEIENTKLLIRYPDNRYRLSALSNTESGLISSKKKGWSKASECHYWRSSGCNFGDKCRYRHIPENKGVDRKPWKC